MLNAARLSQGEALGLCELAIKRKKVKVVQHMVCNFKFKYNYLLYDALCYYNEEILKIISSYITCDDVFLKSIMSTSGGVYFALHIIDREKLIAGLEAAIEQNNTDFLLKLFRVANGDLYSFLLSSEYNRGKSEFQGAYAYYGQKQDAQELVTILLGCKHFFDDHDKCLEWMGLAIDTGKDRDNFVFEQLISECSTMQGKDYYALIPRAFEKGNACVLSVILDKCPNVDDYKRLLNMALLNSKDRYGHCASEIFKRADKAGVRFENPEELFNLALEKRFIYVLVGLARMIPEAQVKAALNKQDERGDTLFHALIYGPAEAWRLLLPFAQSGIIDVNVQNNRGMTVMHLLFERTYIKKLDDDCRESLISKCDASKKIGSVTQYYTMRLQVVVLDF